MAKRFFLAVLILLLVQFLSNTYAMRIGKPGNMVGEKYVEIDPKTKDWVNSKPLKLASIVGKKVVVLDFWATW